MKRRLFVRHLAAGLLLPLVPVELARASGISPSSCKALDEAVKLIRAERLGTIQQLTLTRLYSPGHMATSALADLTQQDALLVNYLLGKRLDTVLLASVTQSPVDSFGSHSGCIDVEKMSVVWQRLARYGAPTQVPSGSIMLAGSRGTMHINLSTLVFNAVDISGQSLLTNKPVSSNHTWQ